MTGATFTRTFTRGIASLGAPPAVLDPSGHFLPSKSKVKRLRERAETRLDADLCHYLQEHRVGRAKSKEQKRQQWLETTQRNYAPPFLQQLRPRMWHIGSALTVSALPAPRLPEVAFCGRSNCGKSTLMNHLCGWGKAYGLSKNCIAPSLPPLASGRISPAVASDLQLPPLQLHH